LELQIGICDGFVWLLLCRLASHTALALFPCLPVPTEKREEKKKKKKKTKKKKRERKQ
jgi:hypothetical protein